MSTFRYLKQAGFNTSRDAVREQVHWEEDSWLLSNISIYSDSLKEQERNHKKIYAIDWELANKNSLIWDGDYSRAFENMVFIHLYQRWHRIHYYLTRKKRQEVDFITVDTHGRSGMSVQACMDIEQEDTLNRELEPMI